MKYCTDTTTVEYDLVYSSGYDYDVIYDKISSA